MYIQRNNIIKKFIIVFLMAFNLNSYASDCPDSFDNTNSDDWLSHYQLTPSEIEDAKKNLMDISTEFEQAVTHAIAEETSISIDSEHFDTFSRDVMLLNLLQEAKQLINIQHTQSKKFIEALGNLISTFKSTSNPSNPKQKTVTATISAQKMSVQTINLLFKDALKPIESRIKELQEELDKPANKNKELNNSLNVDTESILHDLKLFVELARSKIELSYKEYNILNKIIELANIPDPSKMFELLLSFSEEETEIFKKIFSKQ